MHITVKHSLTLQVVQKKKREAIEISVKLRLEFTKLFTDPGIHKIMELIKHKNIQELQLKKPA